MMWNSTGVDLTSLDDADQALLHTLEIVPDENGRTLLFTVDPDEVERTVALLGVLMTTRVQDTTLWLEARAKLRRAARIPPTTEERAGDLRRAHVFGDERSSAERRYAALHVHRSPLHNWYNVVFAPENARLVVVGAITPPVLEPVLARALKRWRSVPRTDPPALVPAPAAPAARVAWFAEDSENTRVTVSCGAAPQDAAEAAVVAEVVRRALWAEVRLATSTYSVDVALGGVSPRRYLTIDTVVEPMAAGPVVAAILRTLGTPPSTASAEAAARWRGAVAVGELRSTRALALTLADGVDPRSIGDDQAAVGATAITAALAPCGGHAVATVIGPESARESLTASGLSVEER